MIKHISKLIFTLAMYELGKYVTEQLIIKYTANDDIDTPINTFNEYDHSDLKRIVAEVSE